MGEKWNVGHKQYVVLYIIYIYLFILKNYIYHAEHEINTNTWQEQITL